MSIKGFVINGNTVKYDYNSLDNKPVDPSGGGVSEDLKTALLQLAQKIAYVDDGGSDYYQDLYDALYGSVTTYTVTNSLTDVTNSNSASVAAENESYTATLSCASNYEITSVTITMGGNDVTGTSYSNGTISIANVTGNIVITAVATERQATLSSISAVFTQGQAVIYDTDSLDVLKQYLVVTATWSDTSTSTVASSDYTLSGTLAEGTSTITVSYGGKSDTFTVTVTHATVPTGYTAYDYIEPTGLSIGNQMKAYGILTNAQMSTDYTLEMKVYLSSSAQGYVVPPLCGTRNGNSGTKEYGLFFNKNQNKFGYWFNGVDTTNVVTIPGLGQLITIKVQPVGVSQTYPTYATINVNGTDYSTGSTSTGVTFEPWFGIYTYAISATGTTTNDVIYNGQRIGEITVKDSNGNLVYDFVPAKDSNNRYGYYENVNREFYYNSTYASTGYTGGYWE